MEKGAGSGLFVNDGSFMEKFKQLQQEQQQKGAAVDGPRSDSSTPLKPALVPTNKRPLDAVKSNDSKKSATAPSSASNGKLAFSFKKKSKIAVAPVKLGADEEEEEEGGGEQQGGVSDDLSKRQRLAPVEAPKMSQKGDVAPSAPSNPEVKKVADKLASFVAKNGRQFENVTRQKNPGDTPFKFLFDPSCSDYKYYEHRLMEEEKALVQSKDSQLHANVSPLTPRSSTGSRKGPLEKQSNYQTPASALYGISEETSSSERIPSHGESSRPSASDPIAMMEFYMKKAAQEERKRQPRQSKDEMPPPSSLQASNKKGHHMGDYIPQEELEKFLSTCNDAAAQKAAREYADRNKIQADNVGHKLLSKMGWKEGEGLGSSKSGRADPVMAGNVKIDNLGVGAQKPGEVTADDDIYEQYKKRMMLGYRYRPNPLNNPRKAYY